MSRAVYFLALLGAACLAAPAALAADFFTKIDPSPTSELWIDTGFYTAHFDGDKDLNDNNKGLALEYRFKGTMTATAGRFYNSDRAWSNYAGVIWQPYAVGPVRVGLALAAFDGYPKTRDGGWFPGAIPTLTYEYKRVGVNVGIIPNYKDRLYGGISFQLKFKLFDR
ncbi:hypothetical protein [Massilia timonae]|uniref:Outer membrane protein beta-barrel domain-containing protein n=1 Tax=Massilia timonae CCUG 45783 TaxID=883126 RepID=K9DF94_9BURK|nr:hypothetical protein [Massilia timonae]EKU81921.1 hypothetical protein HMPREF9710_02875 [Massilia timonae CCUG 45783]